MTSARALLAGVGFCAALASAAGAGQADLPTAVAGAAEGIRLDGVLDEPAWAKATPIGPLLQRDPNEGAPASEETEVRVVVDADNLYFGITCRDRKPSAIVSTQLSRDADLEVDDSVTVVVDPFFDHRNGFFFAVNPAGARADGQMGFQSRFRWTLRPGDDLFLVVGRGWFRHEDGE